MEIGPKEVEKLKVDWIYFRFPSYPRDHDNFT